MAPAGRQLTLFGRRRVAPSAGEMVLLAWRDLWQQRFRAPLTLPSTAAWRELRRQCWRLVDLLPDADTRAAFLECYLADRDPFLQAEGWPLRLALLDGRFQRLAARAEVEVRAERRLAAEHARAEAAWVAAGAPASEGPAIAYEILDQRGTVLEVVVGHALTIRAADRLGWTLLHEVQTRRPEAVGFSIRGDRP